LSIESVAEEAQRFVVGETRASCLNISLGDRFSLGRLSMELRKRAVNSEEPSEADSS
jgi:hypothetical protein